MDYRSDGNVEKFVKYANELTEGVEENESEDEDGPQAKRTKIYPMEDLGIPKI